MVSYKNQYTIILTILIFVSTFILFINKVSAQTIVSNNEAECNALIANPGTFDAVIGCGSAYPSYTINSQGPPVIGKYGESIIPATNGSPDIDSCYSLIPNYCPWNCDAYTAPAVLEYRYTWDGLNCIASQGSAYNPARIVSSQCGISGTGAYSYCTAGTPIPLGPIVCNPTTCAKNSLGPCAPWACKSYPSGDSQCEPSSNIPSYCVFLGAGGGDCFSTGVCQYGFICDMGAGGVCIYDGSPGFCGGEATNFSSSATDYAYPVWYQGRFCGGGIEIPYTYNTTPFPGLGSFVEWSCIAVDPLDVGFPSAVCRATRDNVAVVNGSCGTANKVYPYKANGYGSDTICNTGTASPASPAFPAQGSFINWSCLGSGTGSTASCTAQRQLAPAQLQVQVNKAGQGTVTSNPVGISCGAGCTSQTYNFNPNTIVVLTSTAQSGRIFTGWTGCDSQTVTPTGGTCTVTVTGARLVIANFAIDPRFKEF